LGAKIGQGGLSKWKGYEHISHHTQAKAFFFFFGFVLCLFTKYLSSGGKEGKPFNLLKHHITHKVLSWEEPLVYIQNLPQICCSSVSLQKREGFPGISTDTLGHNKTQGD